MDEARPYHHGDLKAALVRAGLAAVAASGPEAVSLRDLAQSLGVSRAAPYRHFADRKALLAALAAEGFTQLRAAYDQALSHAADPQAALRGLAGAYLSLALTKPGLFRVMFEADAPGAAVNAAVQSVYDVFAAAVARADPAADARTLRLRTVVGWSALHGFVALLQSRRLRGPMIEPLTETEMVEAVIAQTLAPR